MSGRPYRFSATGAEEAIAASGARDCEWSTEVADTYNFHVAAALATITIRRAGMYIVSARVGWEAGTTETRSVKATDGAGALTFGDTPTTVASTLAGNALTLTFARLFAVGDTIKIVGTSSDSVKMTPVRLDVTRITEEQT
jgi:hypothetical protein